MKNPDIKTNFEGKVIYCRHCNSDMFSHLVATHHRNKDYSDSTWLSETWNLFLCPVCDEVTLEHSSVFSEDMDFEYNHDGETVVKPRISILYPAKTSNSLPDPHKDLPQEFFDDYEEARSIAHLSPRSAAALLRLLVEKMCVYLGAEGKDINAHIAFLVRNGLPENVQKAFDIVRLIGNNAVHPGTIDLKDNFEIVSKLFTLINIAVEHQITQPKLIADLYSDLPQQKLDAIARRDGK